MSDASRNGQSEDKTPAMFTPKAPVRDDERPINAWAIAGLVALVIVAVLVVLGRHKAAPPPNTPQPEAAYASQLKLTQLAMSESSSLSGGKSTFIDGHITNNGSSVVTDVTVQVLFHNDEQLPPTVETIPLTLIRTHEPYVDTMPVSSSPIKPGEDREFRLVTESVPQNWNMQMPEMHIIRVGTK